jgi:hypothetical protein
MRTAAPTPNPDGSSPAGSLERGKGEFTPPAGAMRIFVLRSLWAGATAAQSEETPVTAHKELKSIIRERQNKTGESYTAARLHVMRARAEVLGLPETSTTVDQKQHVEAIVLKVNRPNLKKQGGGSSTNRAEFPGGFDAFFRITGTMYSPCGRKRLRMTSDIRWKQRFQNFDRAVVSCANAETRHRHVVRPGEGGNRPATEIALSSPGKLSRTT